MDLPGADAAVRLRELRGRFGDGCVDFTTAPDPEALALCREPLMEDVLATASGRLVCSERNGFHDLAIFKTGVTL